MLILGTTLENAMTSRVLERRVMRQLLRRICKAGKLDKALNTSRVYCYDLFILPVPLTFLLTSLLSTSFFSFPYFSRLPLLLIFFLCFSFFQQFSPSFLVVSSVHSNDMISPFLFTNSF
jgi:hypothetical protein